METNKPYKFTSKEEFAAFAAAMDAANAAIVKDAEGDEKETAEKNEAKSEDKNQ